MTKELQKDNSAPSETSINSMDINNLFTTEFDNLDKKYLFDKDNNISIKAYKAAKEFTKKVILELKEHKKSITFPKILIAGNDSFDIYWKTEKFKVLINIHEDRNGIIHIYGKDFTHSNNPVDTKVNFDLSILYLINWVMTVI